MAPLPQNSTGRVWLKYSTGGGATAQEHEVMLRYSDGLGGAPLGAINLLSALFTTVWGQGLFFTGWQPLSARYSAAGSDFSLPLALPSGLAGFVGDGQASATLVEQARETRFVGRSPTDGRKGSMSFYGIISVAITGNDFRIPPADGNFVAEFLDFVDEMDVGYFVGVGNTRLNFYDYANWQYNSYWEGELRV